MYYCTVPPANLLRRHFLVDQVRRRLDEVQQFVNVAGPIGQDGFGRLRLRESHNVGGPVDLGVHAAVADHAGDLGFEADGFEL